MPSGIYPRKNAQDRFCDSYEVRPEGCWNWKKSTHGPGQYGCFWDGKRLMGAHRFSYEIHVGEIEPGKVLLHKCDNPKCVNPDHLIQGTQKENVHDALKKGRFTPNRYGRKGVFAKRRGQSLFCRKGHCLSIEANVYINPNNSKQRRCKICLKEYLKNRYRKTERKE